MRALLRRWQMETGEVCVLRWTRAALGVLLLLGALRQAYEGWLARDHGEVFRMPMIPERLVPSTGIQLVITALQVALALLVVFGRRARAALFGSAILGFYLLLCDRLQYHNNRYALLLFAFLLSFAPVDRGGPERGPLWAQRLAQLQLCIIYLASGSSKLVDSDWRGGLVIADRLARSLHRSVSMGVPPELMRFLALPEVSSVLAKVAIGTELFLAVGLLLPRVRAIALYWGLVFHVTIELTSQVELFGWLCLAVYALFATPATRERAIRFDEQVAASRAAARVIRSLDWLRRFEWRPADGAARGWTVVDRDGSEARGALGWALTARGIPLLFPLWIPLLCVAKLRGGDNSRTP